jgi:prepilin-type N-terminal cleavage/methylation domain-containing protein
MRRAGFTLIELLMVIVIIGFLASIAIPKFASTKEKAYIATMKSDLRNLVTAEEAYFSESIAYTTNLGTTYSTSTGVVGPTITLTVGGFTAVVRHSASTRTCAVFVGPTAIAPAVKEGEPRCS